MEIEKSSKEFLEGLREISDVCLHGQHYALMGAVTAAMRHRDHPMLKSHLSAAVGFARELKIPDGDRVRAILQRLVNFKE